LNLLFLLFVLQLYECHFFVLATGIGAGIGCLGGGVMPFGTVTGAAMPVVVAGGVVPVALSTGKIPCGLRIVYRVIDASDSKPIPVMI